MLKIGFLTFAFLFLQLPIFSQEPTKLIELQQISKSVAAKKLVPLWKTIHCNEPIDIYVIIYGVTENERRRLVTLIIDSWGGRCEFSNFRGFYFLAGGGPKHRTVIWKLPIGSTPPVP
jgi:hypothetical protein